MQQNKDLYDVLALSKELDQEIYEVIIEMLRKENVSDCLKYLSDDGNLSHCLSILNTMIITNVAQEDLVKNKMKIMIDILKQLKEHDFNKKNYCEDLYKEFNLIKKISKDKQIVQLLQFLVQITTIDETFIQCGSNGLNLLVVMKVDLTNFCFQNI